MRKKPTSYIGASGRQAAKEKRSKRPKECSKKKTACLLLFLFLFSNGILGTFF